MKKLGPSLITILVLVLAGCSHTPQAIPPTRTPTLPPAAPTTPTATISPPPPEASPTPSRLPPTPETAKDFPKTIQLGDPLPDDGRWLLVQMDYRYFLLSEDGEKQIELDPSNYFSDDYIVSFFPSPTREMVAILVGNKALGTDKNLYLWSLSENTVVHIAELYNHEYFSELTYEENDNIYFSTGQVTWSHGGSTLAFTSAHLGATTDLYVYDIAAEETLWLTSGPTQAVNPIWSLDDAFILHAGVDQLHYGRSGRGYEGWQFFSAAPDGSRVHTLAAGSIEGRGDEQYLGWVSDRQMLMHSGYWWCGYFDLRMMNIVSGEEYFIWRGSYSDIAYAPGAGLALVYIDPNAHIAEEDCGLPERGPGLYLLTIPDGQVTEVPMDALPDGYYYLDINNGELPFFIKVDTGTFQYEWFTVDADGIIQPFGGDPRIPEQFWGLGLHSYGIYGWVSSGGL